MLKKYACLWSMNRPANKRPKLYIVNLQVQLMFKVNKMLIKTCLFTCCTFILVDPERWSSCAEDPRQVWWCLEPSNGGAEHSNSCIQQVKTSAGINAIRWAAWVIHLDSWKNKSAVVIVKSEHPLKKKKSQLVSCLCHLLTHQSAVTRLRSFILPRQSNGPHL